MHASYRSKSTTAKLGHCDLVWQNSTTYSVLEDSPIYRFSLAPDILISISAYTLHSKSRSLWPTFPRNVPRFHFMRLAPNLPFHNPQMSETPSLHAPRVPAGHPQQNKVTVTYFRDNLPHIKFSRTVPCVACHKAQTFYFSINACILALYHPNKTRSLWHTFS